MGWWASDIFRVFVPFWLFPGGIELMMKTWRKISEPIYQDGDQGRDNEDGNDKVLMTLGQNYDMTYNDSDKGEC